MPYNPNAIWNSKQKSLPSGEVGKFSSGITAGTDGKETGSLGPARDGWLLWVGIAVISFGLGGFFLYRFLVPTALPSAVVVISAPDKIFVGDPFVLSIAIQNTSDVVLKNTVIKLKLPEGISVVGEAQGQMQASFLVGDIATGTTRVQTSTLIATSGSGSAISLVARVIYGENSGAPTQFQADGSANIVVGDPAVRLGIAAPVSAVAGSKIETVLTYVNNSPDVIGDVRIMLDVPPAFIFSTSSMVRVTDSIWDIGTVASHATGTITVYGSLTSATEATYGFTGSVMIVIRGQSYTIPGPTANIALHGAPLSLAVSVNGSSSYVAGLNDFLSYTIHYANRANVALQGITIYAKLTGKMFDFSTLGSSGSFNSLTNTVMWSPSSVQSLASLMPGASGDLTLRIKTLKNFPIRRADDKEFSLRLDGTIISPTLLPGVVATSTESTAGLITKLGGNFAVTSRGYRYDNVSGIINIGPYPPVVNRETQYTIRWGVTNSADDLQDIILTAALPTGVIFTGKVTSNVSTTPQYDSRTGKVTWIIPLVPATAGIVAQAPQAIFQVAVTPAVNQIGQSIDLLGPTAAQSLDTFTGLSLVTMADLVTTALPSDAIARQVRDNTVQGN